MCYVLVLYQILYDTVYSTHALHVDLCVEHIIEIMETGLYHKIFNIFVRNVIILLNMILPLYPLIYLPINFICIYQSLHV